VGAFDDVKNKAGQYAEDHPDQVEKGSDEAIQRGGDVAERAGGGRFADQVESGEKKADDAIGG
jgi:hypothetical protein